MPDKRLRQKGLLKAKEQWFLVNWEAFSEKTAGVEYLIKVKVHIYLGPEGKAFSTFNINQGKTTILVWHFSS